MPKDNQDVRFYLAKPTQFEAPFFRFLEKAEGMRLIPVFTGGASVEYDIEQGQRLSWGFDLLYGYRSRRISAWLTPLDAAQGAAILVFNGYATVPYLLGALIARFKGCRVFLRTDSVLFSDGTSSSQRMRWLKRLIYSFYDGYLVTGIGGKRFVHNYLGFRSNKVVVNFPYSVDVHFFAQAVASRGCNPPIEHPAIRAMYADLIGETRRRVVVVAKLNAREAPSDLLLCFESFAELSKQFVVTIVGGGPLTSKLRDQVARAGLQDTLRFYGYVPYQSLTWVYGQHDVYYHGPASEPFGVSPIESAAAGLFVITNSRVGAAEELAQHSRWVRIHFLSDLDSLYEALLDVSDCRLDRRVISKAAIAGFGYPELARRLTVGLIGNHSK